MSARAEFDAEAGRVADLIADARRRVAAGESVDLVRMPIQVAHLCELALAAPADDRPDLRAVLDALMVDLDALTADLTAQEESRAGGGGEP
ncbi:MAG: hypothetical protein H6907_17855 [Hyphomicrobiales bacterium]|nr:hypothetical protein [Hyphomicrobiales bacterium]MCP5373598.1 hypothetical protein [Hyphomicrobiales bacterium]